MAQDTKGGEYTAGNDGESERIRKWRAERARVAEREKQERIRKAADERKLKEAETEAEKRAAAEKLLPSDHSLQASQSSIRAEMQDKRQEFLKKAGFFLLLPVVVVVFYLEIIATPLHEVRAVVSISKPANSDTSELVGLFSTVSGGSNMGEVFMAHEFIRSQSMMDMLESELGLISTLSSSAIDPLRRLRTIPALRVSMHSQFSRFVESSTNIQTGLLTLYIRMPSADQAVEVSQAVLDHTAQQINSLSTEIYHARTEQAQASVREARDGLDNALAVLVKLQVESGEADPEARAEGIYITIRELESELTTINRNMAKLSVSEWTDTGQYERLLALKERLSEEVKMLRDQLLLPSTNGSASLNQLLVDYELAKLQVGISEEALSHSLEALSAARHEAALGQSLVQVVVPPRAEGVGQYPKTWKWALITAVFALVLLGMNATFFKRH
ncbi:hypothetical protein ACS0VU_00035 [Aliiroseovarius sp. KMU-71]|uniref:hypothetical protein n=1 Tax=Aliiroseovarius sp. KMU-71 TaxID=3453123 RepID=UPI003F45DA61